MKAFLLGILVSCLLVAPLRAAAGVALMVAGALLTL